VKTACTQRWQVIPAMRSRVIIPQYAASRVDAAPSTGRDCSIP
jgi:hypothetical protein